MSKKSDSLGLINSESLVRGKRKYEQVRSRLLGEIAIGNLRPGDALPTEHRLAEMLRVSRSTVRQTLGELERDGHIRRERGKGTFVSENPVAEPVVASAASFAAIVPEATSGYYATILASLGEAAHDVGRVAIACCSDGSVDKQANHILRLMSCRVSGVLLNPTAMMPTPAFHVQMLQEAGIPVVLLHRSVAGAAAPLLKFSSEAVGCQAGRLLVEHGHQRIAYLASARDDMTVEFESGVRKSLVAAGLELPDTLVDYGHWACSYPEHSQEHERHLEERLKLLLSSASPPTALVAGWGETAEAIYLILQRMGLRLPDDMSIVSLGGANREGAIRRHLTVVTVDEAFIASRAVQLLVEMRDGKRRMQDDEHIVLPLGLSPGSTVSSPSKARV